jgi:hypothetical protein
MRLGFNKAKPQEKALVEFIPGKRSATRDPEIEST